MSLRMLRPVSSGLLLALLIFGGSCRVAMAGTELELGQQLPGESIPQFEPAGENSATEAGPLPVFAESEGVAVNAPAVGNGDSKAEVTLQGTVSHIDDIAPSLDQLFSMTFADDQADVSGKSNQHFYGNFHKLAYKGKNILNYVFDYRAFGPSTEASNVILEEHKRSKSLEASAYQKQRELDEKHLQTVGSIMQLAMGIGMPDPSRGQKLIDSGRKSLNDLIGEKRADEIFTTLEKNGKTLSFPRSLSDQDFFDIQQNEKQIQQIVKSAINSDQTLSEIRKDLHRYNSHSNLSIRATGILQTALSVASFSPTFVAPAAETGYFVLMLATGGPEQDKLLRELYLSKCIESREKVINEKAHLALDSYHMSVLSQNAVLLGCAQSMVRQMCGEATMHEVFGDSAQSGEGVSVVNRSSPTTH